MDVDAKTKPCLVSCSVLRNELEALLKMGALDVDLCFYSMSLHSDYGALEKNLRRKIEERSARSAGEVIVVSGDYCLGQEDEMKKLLAEYGVTKVDALNCIDCLFGGKGKFMEADPRQECLFLSLGWIKYFLHTKNSKEGKSHEEVLRNMFSCLKGIVLLDSLGNLENYEKEIEELRSYTRLPILERRNIGLGNLRHVILEATKRQSATVT
jgi:hypothetical protein